jgi:hypothetical protein
MPVFDNSVIVMKLQKYQVFIGRRNRGEEHGANRR